MAHPESLPWQPIGPGYSVKLLHGGGDDATRALLLRLEPGVVVPRHRHEGEVHALNLAGTRKLLDTGELVGPGGYVYEPTGNLDSWMAVGEETVIVFVTVRGAMEDLDDADRALSRSTTASMTESYQRFVESGAR
ncbi:MAG: cupin domain-containing protein [Kofleriaceae bacterium]